MESDRAGDRAPKAWTRPGILAVHFSFLPAGAAILAHAFLQKGRNKGSPVLSPQV